MNSKEFDSFVRSIIFYSLVGPHPHSFMPLHAARYCACVRAWPQALFTLSGGMSFQSRGAPPPRLGSRLPPLVDARARRAPRLRVVLIERPAYGFGHLPHPLQPGAFGDNDRFQLIDRRRELVVDHDEVVLSKRRDLLARDLEPPLDGFLAVLAPSAKPVLQLGIRWRHDKDADRVDAALAHFS